MQKLTNLPNRDTLFNLANASLDSSLGTSTFQTTKNSPLANASFGSTLRALANADMEADMEAVKKTKSEFEGKSIDDLKASIKQKLDTLE